VYSIVAGKSLCTRTCSCCRFSLAFDSQSRRRRWAKRHNYNSGCKSLHLFLWLHCNGHFGTVLWMARRCLCGAHNKSFGLFKWTSFVCSYSSPHLSLPLVH